MQGQTRASSMGGSNCGLRMRRFLNTVTGDLAQAKEDAAAMGVVRKLVVDGQLPPKSVTYVPATIGRSFQATKQPVAVLIGFLESQPRYMRRHVEIYNERGIDALVVCPTYKNVLWPSTGRKLARTMMDALDMDGFAERPLVIHGFSTGGCAPFLPLADPGLPEATG